LSLTRIYRYFSYGKQGGKGQEGKVHFLGRRRDVELAVCDTFQPVWKLLDFPSL
jgi:hypothetical protein